MPTSVNALRKQQIEIIMTRVTLAITLSTMTATLRMTTTPPTRIQMRLLTATAVIALTRWRLL